MPVLRFCYNRAWVNQHIAANLAVPLRPCAGGAVAAPGGGQGAAPHEPPGRGGDALQSAGRWAGCVCVLGAGSHRLQVSDLEASRLAVGRPAVQAAPLLNACCTHWTATCSHIRRLGDGGRGRVWRDERLSARVHPPAGAARHCVGGFGSALSVPVCASLQSYAGNCSPAALALPFASCRATRCACVALHAPSSLPQVALERGDKGAAMAQVGRLAERGVELDPSWMLLCT